MANVSGVLADTFLLAPTASSAPAGGVIATMASTLTTMGTRAVSRTVPCASAAVAAKSMVKANIANLFILNSLIVLIYSSYKITKYQNNIQ
jgi:hypothetical protein